MLKSTTLFLLEHLKSRSVIRVSADFAEKTDTRPILQAVKVWLQLTDFRKTNCAFRIRFDKGRILIFMIFL